MRSADHTPGLSGPTGQIGPAGGGQVGGPHNGAGCEPFAVVRAAVASLGQAGVVAHLDLLVLHAADVAATRAFYEALGLRFVDERHGSGPPHVAAVLDGGLVLEIYPLPGSSPAPGGGPGPAPRLGFAVPDVAAVLGALGVSGRPLGSGDDGAVVVTDPDGRPVHLTHLRAGRR